MKHDREPVAHTCPDIDKMLKSLKEIRSTIRLSRRASEDELRSSIDDIEYDLSDFEDKLEELRSANDILRKWGIEEAEEVDRLTITYEPEEDINNQPK